MSAIVTLPKLDLGRRLARGLTLAEIPQVVRDVRAGWQADGVLHGELIVDLGDFADAQAALQAVDAAMQPDDPQELWSYALLLTVDKPWPELPALVEDAEVTSVRGLITTGDSDLTALGATWHAAREAGWRQMVHAESGPRLRAAFNLGFARLLGGTGLLREPELLAHLRVHRLPVLLSPSAQIAEKVVNSWQAHPLKLLTDAGVTTVVGSGWPHAQAQSLSAELEAISRHHHWKLEQLRTLMTRNAEAAAIAPEARFGIARQIESWRHRPHAPAGPKGDGWSL